MNDNYIGLSFSLKRRRVLIHRSTLRSLGVPKNIRFLLNMKKKRVAVQVCEAIDRDSFKAPNINENKDSYEITSMNFISIVYRIAKWDENRTYRLEGRLYGDNRLVEFDLMDAEIIDDSEFVDPEV